MKSPKPNSPLLLLAILVGIFAGGCFSKSSAQATTGSIMGRVTDPTHAVITEAIVKAQNEATGLYQTIRTDTDGNYALRKLLPGTYKLTVVKEGFAIAEVPTFELFINQIIRVDIPMRVGMASESITVRSEGIQLQTLSAETGEVIESQQILNLPLSGRKFLDLARLTSGVSNGSGGNNVNLAVNGQREFSNSILVDGVEVSTNRNNDTNIRPSVDAVEEFKVLTSAYAPEFGWASGGIIAIQTKSGSNKIHGSLYEFFRPSTTAARSFFATNRPSLKQHNFGGTVGGPIQKDRTFFFASYERSHIGDEFSFLDSVPPKNQIRFLPNGDVDFSGLKDPFTGKSVPIFDPNFYATNYVAQQFPGNIIPANRVSPAGKAILQNFFPAPNVSGVSNGWFRNYIARQAYSYDSNAIDTRLDHSLSERDRVSGTYHFMNFNLLTGDRFAGYIPVKGGGDADQGDHENLRSQSLAVAETHFLAGSWVNEFRAGFTRFGLDQLSLLNGQNLASQFGLGNINLPGFPQSSGFPNIFLGTGYQTGGSTFKPLSFDDQNLQFSESLAGDMGRHEVKFGIDLRRLRSKPRFSLFPTGFQYYGGPYVSLTSDPNYSFYDASAFFGTGGSDIADLLLGLPYSVNEGLSLTNPTTVSWSSDFYLQDAWRVSNRLVLLYGVRYEYQTPYKEINNRQSNFDPVSKNILLAGRGGNSDTLIQPDRNNLAPRIGFAFQVTPKFVFRAGYGINYSPENDARSDVLTQNFPYGLQQVFVNDIYSGLPFAYNLDSGASRVTSIALPSNASSISAGSVAEIAKSKQNIVFVDPQFRTGYSQLYNFTLESALDSRTTIDLGYAGSVSRKLPYAVGNINANSRITNSLGRIQAQYSEGSASFNSMQVRVRRRWADHFSLLTAYTFGKSIDNGPAPFNLGHNLNSINQRQDPFNLSLERAASDNDITHNLTAGFTYDLPFRNVHGFIGSARQISRALLSDWQINGSFSAHTGSPVNVVRNSKIADFQGLRPNLVGDANLPGSERSLNKYFNTKAFDSSAFLSAASRKIGNAGRNLFRGPGFVNLDLSLCKEIELHEATNLQIRFEFFNLTNTPHFSNPNGDMSSGNFGSITSTISNPRNIQFAAKLTF